MSRKPAPDDGLASCRLSVICIGVAPAGDVPAARLSWFAEGARPRRPSRAQDLAIALSNGRRRISASASATSGSRRSPAPRRCFATNPIAHSRPARYPWQRRSRAGLRRASRPSVSPLCEGRFCASTTSTNRPFRGLLRCAVDVPLVQLDLDRFHSFISYVVGASGGPPARHVEDMSTTSSPSNHGV